MTVPQSVPVASRVKAPWLVRLRGLLAVPVAVALVLGAPGLAYAAFTAKTTAALTVGTYKIPAPASINGTLRCTNAGGQRGAVITFDDFDEVDRATGYAATLTPPSGPAVVSALPAAGHSRVTIATSGGGNGKGTYTFRLTAKVGSWTGAALQQSVTC